MADNSEILQPGVRGQGQHRGSSRHAPHTGTGFRAETMEQGLLTGCTPHRDSQGRDRGSSRDAPHTGTGVRADTGAPHGMHVIPGQDCPGVHVCTHLTTSTHVGAQLQLLLVSV